MARVRWSWRRRVVGVAAVVLAGYVIFGSFGTENGPLGTGQRSVTAQASQSWVMKTTTIPAEPGGPVMSLASPVSPSKAQVATAEAQMAKAAGAMAARIAALPPSNPRVRPSSGPPPANTMTMTPRPRAAPVAVDSDFLVYRQSELNPGAAGLNTHPITAPAVAQSGKHVFETFNWGAGRSIDGGTNWSYINPYADMSDFCCGQDAVYDKSRNRMFWLRQGNSNAFSCGANCVENRDRISVSGDGFATISCSYSFFPSNVGQAGLWFNFPRLALSDNYLYVVTDLISQAGFYQTHILLRLPLTPMATCNATLSYQHQTFSSTNVSWVPGIVEGAREVMYMGGPEVTNSGLNDQFALYWIYESDFVLNKVMRTLPTSYSFTDRHTAHCFVPGGANPCDFADQRVNGAVIAKNTPLPNNIGAAADIVHFFWNVKEGNGFVFPYVEHASFHAGTLLFNTQQLDLQQYRGILASGGRRERQVPYRPFVFHVPARAKSIYHPRHRQRASTQRRRLGKGSWRFRARDMGIEFRKRLPARARSQPTRQRVDRD